MDEVGDGRWVKVREHENYWSLYAAKKLRYLSMSGSRQVVASPKIFEEGPVAVLFILRTVAEASICGPVLGIYLHYRKPVQPSTNVPTFSYLLGYVHD